MSAETSSTTAPFARPAGYARAHGFYLNHIAFLVSCASLVCVASYALAHLVVGTLTVSPQAGGAVAGLALFFYVPTVAFLIGVRVSHGVPLRLEGLLLAAVGALTVPLAAGVIVLNLLAGGPAGWVNLLAVSVSAWTVRRIDGRTGRH